MFLPTPNTITQNSKEFYISYNYRDRAIYGSDTTALFLEQIQHFYILNGNHTEQYKQCQTLNDCLEYFKNNISLINKYSDKLE